MLPSAECFLLVEHRSQQVKPDIVSLHLALLTLFPSLLQIVVPLLGIGRTFPSHETFSLLVPLAVKITSHSEERREIKQYACSRAFIMSSLAVLVEELRVCLLHLALAYADS